MVAVLRCEPRRKEPRLEIPLRFAPLMAFHTVIDHDFLVDSLSRIDRMVPRTGEAFWGLGSLRRKEGYMRLCGWSIDSALPLERR